MSAPHVDLISHWRIPAPRERVWAALADPAGWPRWWPQAREVTEMRAGRPDGIGRTYRLRWATGLLSDLVVEIEALEAVRHERLRGRSQGHLRGEGIWLLRESPGLTEVTYVWRVALAARWMRWLAPLLAPVFRWNHERVMRAGEHGLARHLALECRGSFPTPKEPSMTDPTDVIRSAYAAFGSGDLPALLDHLTDDIEWTFEGSTGDAYMRTARGKADVMRWFEQVLALDGIQAFEPRQMLAGTDHVTVLGWERTQSLPAGGVFETPWIHVWQLRGGRVHRFLGMYDTAAAARARAEGLVSA